MSIEAGIGEKVDKAFDAKKDKPDLSSVFEDWKNNTSKADNQAERKSINDAVHKHLPNLTVIEMGIAKTPNGDLNLIKTYDFSTHKLEVRKIEDFSIIESADISQDLKKSKLSDEVFVQKLTDAADTQLENDIAKSKDKENKPASENPNTNPAEKEKTQPGATELKSIKIESGDNLWKIAKREIIVSKTANGTPDYMPSPIEVKAMVDKIFLANQTGDNAIKNVDRIYAGKTLNIPIEKNTSTTKTPEGKTPNPPEGNTTNPPEGKTPNPPEGNTTNPPEGKTPNPPEGNTTNPPEGNTTNPPEGNTTNPPEGENITPSKSVTELTFAAQPNSPENPTIGQDEAKRETEIMTKYFAQMRGFAVTRPGSKGVTADEMKNFIDASEKKLAESDGKLPDCPSKEELDILKQAYQNHGRIASADISDLAGMPLTGKPEITNQDLKSFVDQEKKFESAYQANFYLDLYFARMAPGKDSVAVKDIRDYRNYLAENKSGPSNASELIAIDNLLEQIKLAKMTDSQALKKVDAKNQFSTKVDGNTYQQYGGRNPLAMSAPTAAVK